MQLFVEHLTTIDSAYLHPEHGLVGESWIVDVALDGALDHASMVMDFAHVKKRLKAAIDGSLDHVLIAPGRARNLYISYSPPQGGSKTEDGVVIEWRFGKGEKLVHYSPKSSVALLDSESVTDLAMITYLERILAPVLPSTVTRLRLTLRHETTNDSYYHYVHGLKKHDGHCQRIAHGHRSRILIWRNGARDLTLEAAWAADWKTAYLGSREDITGEHDGMINFAYDSGEGHFALSYPASRCRLLNTDSTVELIAEHIAATLKARDPAASFQVRAYEGVQKGAVAEA
ncbi:MAG: 6-carboxytetrahydropterin synthase [Alphaproteobacteria bacterium]